MEIIEEAYGLLNVYMPGESPTAPDANSALRKLNGMIGQWALQNLTIPAITRTVFDTVANQASYTVGTGGNVNIPRPPNQNSIVGASLVLTNSSPTVETGLAIYTDDQYNAIPVKGLTSGQPSGVYYNPTYTAGFGTLSPWPIPTVNTNDIALYVQQALVEFATLQTAYILPTGCFEVIYYQLALRLAGSNGRTMSEDDKQIARDALRIWKRSNVKICDMPNAFAGIGSTGRWGYDINIGNG